MSSTSAPRVCLCGRSFTSTQLLHEHLETPEHEERLAEQRRRRANRTREERLRDAAAEGVDVAWMRK